MNKPSRSTKVKSMSHRITLTLTAAVLATSVSAYAAGDPQAGKTKAAEKGCVACHGQTGQASMPVTPAMVVPHIGGQYADYLVHTLKAYRSGERQNPNMNGLAAGLSDQDIKDLAAHYAAQEGLQVVDPE